MSINKIKNNQISSCEELLSYLETKAKNHNSYKYYSSRKHVESILKEGAIFAYNGEKWNDTLDKANLNKTEGITNFSFCMSYSKSESIAMWLLYGGNSGCMLEFNKSTIRSIVEADYIELGFFSEETERFQPQSKIYHSDFQLHIYDVIYYDEMINQKTDSYYVKRSDETAWGFDRQIIDNLDFCKKTNPWSYENECRIIVSVRNELIPKGTTHAEIRFDEKHKQELKSRVYDSPNVENGIYKGSNLKGKINWNICNKCDERCTNRKCENRESD